MIPRSDPTTVRLPLHEVGPLRKLGSRALIAVILLATTALIVYIGRSGYQDTNDGTRGMSLLDAFYYATVTLSTTGYGDIVPVTDEARLITTAVITPLRFAFLAVLVGTTIEVLTERTRYDWRLTRWRKKLHDHTVVVGYGTKGRSAVDTMRRNGVLQGSIVVVDRHPELIKEASADGYSGVVGDADRSSVLLQAGVREAKYVIVATDRDDTSVLVTLTARQLNPSAVIVAAVREAENVPLLRQSGATSVITSSEAAGRLLSVATSNPDVSNTIAELLVPGEGLDIVERAPLPSEVGKDPADCPALIVTVLRDGRRLYYNQINRIDVNDRLIIVST